MIVPRIGALILLIAFGYGLALIGRLVYVTAREGYSSWIPLLAFLTPATVVGLASAGLVLRRHPLGARLVLPFSAVAAVTLVIVLLGGPPAGRFLADYERAALARGVEVPEYRAEQGWSPQRYIDYETGQIRTSGGLGALAAIAVFAVLVRARGLRQRPGARPRESANA